MTSFIWHKSAGVMASPPRRMTVESFGDSERERKDTPIKNLPMTLILWLDGKEIGMSDIIQLFNGGEESV